MCSQTFAIFANNARHFESDILHVVRISIRALDLYNLLMVVFLHYIFQEFGETGNLEGLSA
jgi:hypothetical protein